MPQKKKSTKLTETLPKPEEEAKEPEPTKIVEKQPEPPRRNLDLG